MHKRFFVFLLLPLLTLAGVFATTQHVKADTFCTAGWYNGTQICAYEFTVNLDSSSYNPGATITTSGMIRSTQCDNEHVSGENVGLYQTIYDSNSNQLTPMQTLYYGTVAQRQEQSQPQYGNPSYFVGYVAAPGTPSSSSYIMQFHATSGGYSYSGGWLTSSPQDAFDNMFFNVVGPNLVGEGSGPDNGSTITWSPSGYNFTGWVGEWNNIWSGAFWSVMQFDYDPSFATGGVWYGGLQYNNLPINGFTTGNVFSPGSHVARICVDVTGAVNETNENDNCGAWTSFNVVCASGTSWNGSSCVAPTPTVSSLVANGCTVPAGGGSCSSSFSWSASGTNNGLVDANLLPPWNAEYSWWPSAPANNGGSTNGGFTPGNWTVKLYNHGTGTLLASQAFTVSCASGTTWNGSICATNPTPPPQSSSISASCTSSGTLNLSWPAAPGATGYEPVFYIAAGNSCPSGWQKWDPTTQYTECYIYPYAQTAVTANVPPGSSGWGTVFSINSAGANYTDTPPSANFSCTGPTGSITKADSCTIAAGASTCATSFTWTTANSYIGAGGGQLDVYYGTAPLSCPWDKPNGGSTCNGPTWSAWAQNTNYWDGVSGGGTIYTLPYGTHTVALYGAGSDGVWVGLDTKLITATCAPGSTWNGSKCAVPPPTLCANGSCSTTNWTTTCTPGTQCSCSFNGSSVDSSCSTSPSGSCGATGGNTGSGTFTGTATCTTVSVSCNVSGTTSVTVCPAPPQISLSANPTRVRSGTATNLTWSSAGATSCTLTGTNGFSSSATSGTNVSSGAITAQTSFTLTCNNSAGPASANATVFLPPSIIEK